MCKGLLKVGSLPSNSTSGEITHLNYTLELFKTFNLLKYTTNLFCHVMGKFQFY